MVVQVMPVYNCSVTPIQSSWGQKKKKKTDRENNPKSGWENKAGTALPAKNTGGKADKMMEVTEASVGICKCCYCCYSSPSMLLYQGIRNFSNSKEFC